MKTASRQYNFIEHGIPDYMQDGLVRWVEDRIPPGGFLQAVLCDKLGEAVARADDTNIRLLAGYVRFLYNEVPDDCHGSPEKVRAWCHTELCGRLEYFARKSR